MCSPAERMIMSLAAELACAARALGAAGERLQLPDAVLVEEWLKLEDAVDDAHGRGGQSYGSCSCGEPSTNDLPIVTCTEAIDDFAARLQPPGEGAAPGL
jgi:hypothetical protein